MSGRIEGRSGGRQVMRAGERANLVAMRWADKRFDPLPVRVAICVEDEPGVTPVQWGGRTYVNLVATLSYGNDGGGSTYEVDVRRGVVATIQPCQSLQVEIAYRKAPYGFQDGPPLRVSVSAVYGDAPSQQVPRSDFFGAVSALFGPFTTDPLRIPAFADRVSIASNNTLTRPLNGVWLIMWGDNTGGIPLAVYNLAERQEAQVTQGAEFYSVYLSTGQQYITASWLIVA